MHCVSKKKDPRHFSYNSSGNCLIFYNFGAETLTSDSAIKE